jgi:hypothetical protein
VPLLGAGCRAFPRDVALDVVAKEASSWLLASSNVGGGMVVEEITNDYDDDDDDEEEEGRIDLGDTVAFGLLEEEDAMDLSDRLRGLLLDRR